MGQSEEREGMNRDFTLFISYARSGEAGCMRCAFHHEMLWHGYYPNVPFVNDESLLTKARYSDLSTLCETSENSSSAVTDAPYDFLN